MREYAVILSGKGQFALPAEARRELDLERGARLRLIVHDDGSVQLVRPRFQRVGEIAGTENSDADVLYSFDYDFALVSTIRRQEP